MGLEMASILQKVRQPAIKPSRNCGFCSLNSYLGGLKGMYMMSAPSF